jgi:hypothetical protein
MNVSGEIVKKQLLEMLEETFERGHGIFLDRGTSLFETIEAINFEKASRHFHGIPETIAAHVNHLVFYTVVLKEYISGTRTGPADWASSWKLTEVDEAGWNALKDRLREEYEATKKFAADIDGWKNEDYLGGCIAIIAHGAFHLGIIRMLKDF